MSFDRLSSQSLPCAPSPQSLPCVLPPTYASLTGKDMEPNGLSLLKDDGPPTSGSATKLPVRIVWTEGGAGHGVAGWCQEGALINSGGAMGTSEDVGSLWPRVIGAGGHRVAEAHRGFSGLSVSPTSKSCPSEVGVLHTLCHGASGVQVGCFFTPTRLGTGRETEPCAVPPGS